LSAHSDEILINGYKLICNENVVEKPGLEANAGCKPILKISCTFAVQYPVNFLLIFIAGTEQTAYDSKY